MIVNLNLFGLFFSTWGFGVLGFWGFLVFLIFLVDEKLSFLGC